MKYSCDGLNGLNGVIMDFVIAASDIAKVRKDTGGRGQKYYNGLAEKIKSKYGSVLDRLGVRFGEIALAESTSSVYLPVMGNGEYHEIRFSNHTKYGRNRPTDILPYNHNNEMLAKKLDRAVRAAASGKLSYSKIPTWTKLTGL